MNIFDGIVPPGPSEQMTLLAQSSGVRIERIVSHGHRSAPDFWYDQNEDEWVYLVSGKGTLAFDDGRRMTLSPGDHCFIPAHCRHRVEETANDTIWIAVFMPSGPAATR